MVFFYLFLTLSYTFNTVFKHLFKNNFTDFFKKNIDLKKKIYDPQKDNLRFDYRTEIQIKEAKSTSPLLFKDAFLNYYFFKNNKKFNKSFENLLGFFKVNNKFVAFFFLYRFLYNRFFQPNSFSHKKVVYLNKYFHEFFFLCFYFFKEISFENNFFFYNKHTYILKNITKLRNAKIKKQNILENHLGKHILNSKVAAYNNIFNKFQKFNNFFLVGKVNVLFNNFFKKNFILNVSNSDLKKNWNIVFYNSFIYKYICNTKLSSYNVYFLRKNRMFNKGRYSRNRQNYRTGVYWCLYINIVAVFTIYYFFYRFSFNFGYLWWLLAIGINCFFFNKFVKYKLYTLQNYLNNINAIYQFYLNIALNCKNFIFNFIFKTPFIKNNSIFINLSKKNNFFKKIIFYFLSCYFFLLTLIRKIV